jgi:bifunctional DNA-binding transcriptional regulator/antitoxin component of YhaV-PrlF toxin-antitoxin module
MENIQIRTKGLITLPAKLRRQYKLNEGDVMTLVDLGDGCFMLMPKVSQVARLGDEIARIMKEKGISLDNMLQALEEERERYYQEHYAQS